MIILLPVEDLLNMFGFQKILSPSNADLIRGINKKYFPFFVCFFVLLKNHHASGQLCAVENIRTESNNRFQQILFEQFFTNSPFSPFPEQSAMWQNNGHTSVAIHRFYHVLNP